MMKQPCVYIMANRRNGTIYVGVTSDLVKRVHEHRSNAVDGFTKQNATHLLVWYEQHVDMISAISREKQMKKWLRGAKARAIERMNPDWRDLWPEVIGTNGAAVHGAGFRQSLPE